MGRVWEWERRGHGMGMAWEVVPPPLYPLHLFSSLSQSPLLSAISARGVVVVGDSKHGDWRTLSYGVAVAIHQLG